MRLCGCGCGRSIEGRPAKTRFFEPKCRKEAFKARQRDPAPEPASAGHVVATHRAELERMGLADSSEGSVALALASLLDAQRGAVGAAATAERLLRLMETLRKRQPSAKTPLELMRERRARRGA
jgi:hypothetical protein